MTPWTSFHCERSCLAQSILLCASCTARSGTARTTLSMCWPAIGMNGLTGIQNSRHGENIHLIGEGYGDGHSGRSALHHCRSTTCRVSSRGPGGKPRAQIAPPKLTTLFSRAGAPPAFEVGENRCKTTEMASGLAAYVRSSGIGGAAIATSSIASSSSRSRETAPMPHCGSSVASSKC